MKKKTSDRLTPAEALIYAMVTTSAVDRVISTEEIGRIGALVHELPSLRSYDDDWLSGAAQDCGRLLARPNGIGDVLALIEASLPASLRETAYVLCAEVAATDLSVNPEEERFLAMLAAALGLDALVCAALARAAHARQQKA